MESVTVAHVLTKVLIEGPDEGPLKVLTKVLEQLVGLLGLVSTQLEAFLRKTRGIRAWSFHLMLMLDDQTDIFALRGNKFNTEGSKIILEVDQHRQVNQYRMTKFNFAMYATSLQN
ncbi:hypothetical protein E4U41_002359, partial [Claviceps citrina]